jgi:Tfp pilus assembly PilM family ATPase
VLKAVALEFKLSAAIDAIDKKMEFAKYLPLTKGEDEEELQRQIKRELGL